MADFDTLTVVSIVFGAIVFLIQLYFYVRKTLDNLYLPPIEKSKHIFAAIPIAAATGAFVGLLLYTVITRSGLLG